MKAIYSTIAAVSLLGGPTIIGATITGGGSVTSAGMPDPYVPVDGTMNVTGNATLSGSGLSTDWAVTNGGGVLVTGQNRAITLTTSDPSVRLEGTTADGASAIGVRIAARNDYTTSGAKIASFGDNAGVSYAEKAYVNLDGKFVTTNPGGYYLGDLNWGAKYDTSDNNLEFRASAGAGRYFSFEGGGGGDGSANRRFAISVDDGTVVMTPVAVSITGAYTALPAGAIVQATLTGAQTWTITESGAINGQTHTICNIDTTPDVLTMDHVAGQVLLNGAADVALGQNDCLTVYYSTAASAWIQSGATSNN